MEITGFIGIKFGESVEDSIFKMLEKGARLDEDNSSNTGLIFDGITFAGRNTDFFALNFFNKQLFRGSVYLLAPLEAHTTTLYREIKNEINNKYFKTTLDYETHKNPAFNNEALINTGIKSGYTEFSCFWKFPNQDGGDNYITIKINPDLRIVISYEEGTMALMNQDYHEKLNSQDY